MDERVADLVQQAFAGEVLGVELFRCLADAETDPDKKQRLVAAGLLEQQTKAAAARLAADLGVEVTESDDDRDAGRRAGEFLATLGWDQRMSAIGNATGNYRALYAQLAEVVPDPAHPCVTALVAHEQALNAFALAEAEGDPAALDRLREALEDDYRSQLDAVAH